MKEQVGKTRTVTEKTPVCSNCKAAVNGSVHKVRTRDKGIALLCDRCFNSIKSEFKKQSEDINYLYAILLSVALGIVGALLWFGVVVITKWQVGIVSVVVGLLVAMGIFKGSGNKRSEVLQLLSAVIALLSILFGEYLIMNHYVRDYFISEGYQLASYFGNPVYIMGYVFKSLAEDPITLLFWGIAVWVAFSTFKPLRLKEIRRR